MVVFVIISIFPAIGTAYLLTHGDYLWGAIGALCTLTIWGYLWSNFTSTDSRSVYERAEADYIFAKQSWNAEYVCLIERVRECKYDTPEYWKALSEEKQYKIDFDNWDRNECRILNEIASNPLNHVVKNTRG